MLESVLSLSFCVHFSMSRLALDFQSVIQQRFETTETTKNWTKEDEDVLLDELEKKDWDLLDFEEIY